MTLPDDFGQEQIREGYRVTREMKEVWAVSLDMAVKLIDVCERHGLKVWMDSGTLLGAVRHKGFIPWDDDIDFVMMRDDYDRLCHIADHEFQPPYFFQTTYSDTELYSGHGRLRRSDTTAMSLSERGSKYNRGIAVDIFVLDGFPENGLIRFLHRTATMLLKKTIRTYVESTNPYRTKQRPVLGLISRCIYALVPYKQAFALYERMFRIFPAATSRRVSVCAYRYSTHSRVRLRSAYDQTIYLPFEGIMMPAPADTDEALRCYFGASYMTPVHSPTAHGHLYLDARQPYTEVADKLLQHPGDFDERLKLLYTD